MSIMKIVNNSTGEVQTFDVENFTITFESSLKKDKNNNVTLSVPDGKTMKEFVAQQLKAIEVGESVIANVIGAVSIFRMNVSQFAQDNKTKYQTRINAENELIIKRLK